MRQLFSNKYRVLLLIVTVVLLVLAAVYSASRARVSFGEDLVTSVVAPFQKIGTNISNGIKKFTTYFTDIDDLTAENKRLSQQVDDLERKIRTIEQYKIENEQLRAALELKQNTLDYNTCAAEVIAKDVGVWYDSFTINKGTNDGLKVNQAVITSKGLVGSISEVGSNWAKVVSIIDSDSAVGCTISRIGDLAVAEGNVDLQQDALCKMTYVSNNSHVIVGDLVETSGLGGIYPKGLLIGTVREIHPDSQSVSQYAVVEPAVDFNKISTVLVIQD